MLHKGFEREITVKQTAYGQVLCGEGIGFWIITARDMYHCILVDRGLPQISDAQNV